MAALLFANGIHAQNNWSDDPNVNTLLSAGNGVTGPECVLDGAGGAFYVWFHGTSSIEGQRLDACGNPQWTAGGKALVGVAAGGRIVSGGAGTMIVTWEFLRAGGIDIYAQRYN